MAPRHQSDFNLTPAAQEQLRSACEKLSQQFEVIGQALQPVVLKMAEIAEIVEHSSVEQGRQISHAFRIQAEDYASEVLQQFQETFEQLRVTTDLAGVSIADDRVDAFAYGIAMTNRSPLGLVHSVPAVPPKNSWQLCGGCRYRVNEPGSRQYLQCAVRPDGPNAEGCSDYECQ